MSVFLPTNISFACTRRNLSGMTALLKPISIELAAMQGAPVGKLYEVHFTEVEPDLRENDLLTNEANNTDSYRIKGIEHFNTPKLAHTYAVVEKGISQ